MDCLKKKKKEKLIGFQNLFISSHFFIQALLFALTKIFPICQIWQNTELGLTSIPEATTLNISEALLSLVSATHLNGVWKHFPCESVVRLEARASLTQRVEQRCQTKASQQRKW